MSDKDTLESLRNLTQKRSGKREIGKALNVSSHQVKTVAGKGKGVMHGQYKNVLVRLYPHDAERIDEVVAQTGLNKEDAKRWLVLRGLQAFDEGDMPEMEPVQVMKLKRP